MSELVVWLRKEVTPSGRSRGPMVLVGELVGERGELKRREGVVWSQPERKETKSVKGSNWRGDAGGWALEKRQEGGMGRLAQRARNSEVEEGRWLECCQMEPHGGCIQMAGWPSNTVGAPSQALASVQIRSASRQHWISAAFPIP